MQHRVSNIMKLKKCIMNSSACPKQIPTAFNQPLITAPQTKVLFLSS